MLELSAWLHTSGPNIRLPDCIPEDVLAYLVNWWDQEHGGISGRGRCVAPVSLEALCSRLTSWDALESRAPHVSTVDPAFSTC